MRGIALSVASCVGLLSSMGGAHAADTACTAQCLSDFADKYIAALVAHDSSSLPVAPSIRAAENSHAAALGENLWKVIVSAGDKKQYFADPTTGQVIVFDRIELHGGEPFIFALRLKVTGGKIAEAETMVTSDKIAGQHFKPDNLTNFDSLYTAAVAQDKRSTRETLLNIADAHWHMQDTADSFAPDCIHSENADRLPQLKCAPARRGGMFNAYRAIRHPVVDVERGLVFTYVLQDATPHPNPIPDGEKTPIFYLRPVTFYTLEILKIIGGKIAGHALFMNVQEANAPAPFVE